MNSFDSIRTIKGVGAKTEEAFSRLGISYVSDFLSYYPREYEFFPEPTSLNQMKAGVKVAVKAKIAAYPQVITKGKRKIIRCKVKDATGTCEFMWYQMVFLSKIFRVGQEFIFYGTPVIKQKTITLEHPKYYTVNDYTALCNTFRPIYPLTHGLTNTTVQKTLTQVIPYFLTVKEFLSLDSLRKLSMMDLPNAFKTMHFPAQKEQVIEARRRLVFQEFLLFFFYMQDLKEHVGLQENQYILDDMSQYEQIKKKLPFQLTKGQEKVLLEIKQDVTSPHTMNRLLQGDVGSGKTAVALLSLCLVVEKGYQGALMAPTEVLANQHFEEFNQIFQGTGIKVALLTGNVKGTRRKEVLAEIEQGDVQIVIGTHALIQEKVNYKKLAMIIVDEQHRFGVAQREKLWKKGLYPHVLVMSATPIPRTLALMLYGDMDISVMTDKPANRLPIKNCVVGVDYRKSAYQFMNQAIKKGQQVYIICPMIEESENTELENVISYTKKLQDIFPSSVTIKELHGGMKADEKDEIMDAFSKNEIQILVSTTVIEVGINVPNATIILIENAERFGLAQLHQLRGRVGRGKEQSYCIFLTKDEKPETKERLSILEKSGDGFYIANEDLKLRGPGDFFGIRQSGDFDFELADIYQDADLLKDAKEYYDSNENDADFKASLYSFKTTKSYGHIHTI